MTAKTNLQKVHAAMRYLEKKGWFAPQKSHCCCMNCGFHDTPDDTEGVIFYHVESEDNSICLHCNDLKSNLYLNWDGDGEYIVKVFKKHGLKVEWDGSEGTTICIIAPPRTLKCCHKGH